MRMPRVLRLAVLRLAALIETAYRWKQAGRRMQTRNNVRSSRDCVIEIPTTMLAKTPNEAREGLKFPKLEDNDTIRVPQNITGSATDATQGGRPVEGDSTVEEETNDE